MSDKGLNGLTLQIAKTFFGNFKTLGPVQIVATKPILEGSDTLILSGTGSGKTEAAVAPTIQLHFEKMMNSESPIILYISPTRALANDIYKRLEPAFNHLRIPIGIRHGEQDDTASGEIPKFLITTPESLDILLTRKPKILLEVEVILVDECHLLFNTQRGFQLSVVLRRIEILRQKTLLTIGMSSTVGDGQSLWKFFRPGKEVAIVHAPNQRDIQHRIYFNCLN
jgi:ATP-dependent Lhr-like helicase